MVAAPSALAPPAAFAGPWALAVAAPAAPAPGGVTVAPAAILAAPSVIPASAPVPPTGAVAAAEQAEAILARDVVELGDLLTGGYGEAVAKALGASGQATSAVPEQAVWMARTAKPEVSKDTETKSTPSPEEDCDGVAACWVMANKVVLSGVFAALMLLVLVIWCCRRKNVELVEEQVLEERLDDCHEVWMMNHDKS
eukprot:TRINITY_DN957_c0_g1_i1.p1 TRINITY_DN957_c0_g1~~TRINITY_DN957_c0_g1_i1.p1  ORF type:complete len:214 (-),score=60.86 TRINITY_DN957_c0_g1_i1:74-664(-)